MDRIVECVPNFSEGRKADVVVRLAEAVESVEGALVLGTHVDPDHNRSVITFVAPPRSVVEAALRVVARAAELIDLSLHAGQHPRMGACDVLPFVPVRGVSVEECVALARAAGARIWRELQIPVYFYESAATRLERKNLADVRRGGFELLREEIGTKPERAPDVGEPRLHPTAGACIVGVRPLLIAYNVPLDTRDLSVAKRIARAVRERDGGLLHLKALGFELESRGVVQVSMNLTSYEHTNIHQAFEAVRREAEKLGVEIIASEIVGLVPQAALDRAAAHYLQLENYSPDLVLENRIAAALERKRARASDASRPSSPKFSTQG
jgi:glutamate formiminotransferase